MRLRCLTKRFFMVGPRSDGTVHNEVSFLAKEDRNDGPRLQPGFRR
jgi:hypothetical protein